MITFGRQPSNNQLPCGILILVMLFGFIAFVGGAVLIFALLARLGPYAISVALLFAGVFGLCAFGLNKRAPWAWYLVFGIQAYLLLLTVWRLDQGESPVWAILNALPALIIIYYLLRPHVRQAFTRQPAGPSHRLLTRRGHGN